MFMMHTSWLARQLIGLLWSSIIENLLQLPTAPSGFTDRHHNCRPSSGGATKLPSPPVALPAAQASPRPVIKASAFLSAQALAQADQLLSSCFAKAPTPGLFPRRQRTSGQEDLKDAAAPSYRAAERFARRNVKSTRELKGVPMSAALCGHRNQGVHTHDMLRATSTCILQRGATSLRYTLWHVA